MLYRGVAVLGLLAVSPANASLIEYSFTSTIANYGGVHEDVVGDRTLGTTGDEIWIGDAAPLMSSSDTLRLGVSGDGGAVNGYFGNGIQILLREWFCGSPGPFMNGGASSNVPKSVPEPLTASLLAMGAFGAVGLRRRKQAADRK